jgi:hypothetical protein
MQLQIGDVIVSRRLTGFQVIGSAAIAWWLHSTWSHVMPVLANGMVLDITMPSPKIVNSSIFISPDYKVRVFRPIVALTEDEKTTWCNMADALVLKKYDLESFGGFILDDPSIKDSKKVNCAEGTLLCHKAIGRLMNYDGRLVSPQTFDDFACGGLYTVVDQNV